MKIYFYLLLILSVLYLFVSCNKDEGLGGSSSIEGYVYNVVHKDDNFSFARDTIPAVKEDVYLIFGDEAYFGDDVETDKDGRYHFDYLRKGNYTVYAYSSYADASKKAEIKSVKIGSGLNMVEDIYIHTGKANGTAMIKGAVQVSYYDKGRKVDEGPGVGTRVYIKYQGEDTHFDDVRAGDAGIFIFQKLLPGIYEVYTTTEDPDTEKVTSIIQTIEITETEKIYEISETYNVIVTV